MLVTPNKLSIPIVMLPLPSSLDTFLTDKVMNIFFDNTNLRKTWVSWFKVINFIQKLISLKKDELYRVLFTILKFFGKCKQILRVFLRPRKFPRQFTETWYSLQKMHETFPVIYCGPENMQNKS